MKPEGLPFERQWAAEAAEMYVGKGPPPTHTHTQICICLEPELG